MNIRKKAQRKIKREFLRFKRTLLVHYTKEEIFECCGKIQFYTCMEIYFEQNEEISEAYLWH